MSMPDIDLFAFWALSISFSIIFLTFVSIYLYFDSRARRKENVEKTAVKRDSVRLVESFAFVWVLLGLLVFYIFSIQLGTSTLTEIVFAVGNIIVEALLVLYLLKNREKKSEQP
jgi:amino acid transporter